MARKQPLSKSNLRLILAVFTVGFGLGFFVRGGDIPEPLTQMLPRELRPPRVVAPGEFHVLRVIDGDTFVVLYDEEKTSVRILGIDAPEVGDPGGSEATAALRDLIDDKVVRLYFEGDRKRDKYGRLLAAVEIGGLDVATDLLERRLVRVYR